MSEAGGLFAMAAALLASTAVVAVLLLRLHNVLYVSRPNYY
jgi:hypothetical protein